MVVGSYCTGHVLVCFVDVVVCSQPTPVRTTQAAVERVDGSNGSGNDHDASPTLFCMHCPDGSLRAVLFAPLHVLSECCLHLKPAKQQQYEGSGWLQVAAQHARDDYVLAYAEDCRRKFAQSVWSKQHVLWCERLLFALEPMSEYSSHMWSQKLTPYVKDRLTEIQAGAAKYLEHVQQTGE